MKLYATVTSEKGGRTASKAGDKEIRVSLHDGNKQIYQVTFKGDTLQVLDAQKYLVLFEDRKTDTAQRN